MAKSYKYSRSRKPLTLKEAKLRMTDAVKAMEEIILDGEVDHKTINTKIQAVHALSGIVSRYAKLHEIVDHEERIDKLEQELKNKKR